MLPGYSLPKQSLRFLSPKILGKVKVEIDRMVREGILVPTDTAMGGGLQSRMGIYG
jgi:hypothetical protein